MSKRVAIIGGGVAGTKLAKALDDDFEVLLIEQKSHFVQTSAMIRAVVKPELLNDALIPYDNLLKSGKVIRARASAINEQGVDLDGGEFVAADYIVVATGSQNALPFKPLSDDIDAFRKSNKLVHEQLLAANKVVIVGAGPVGIELAGEIAFAMPGKDVTLVSSNSHLFPNKPEKFGRILHKKLVEMGVDLRLGALAKGLKDTQKPYSGDIELSDGEIISADLIFPTIGSRAVSDILTSLPKSEIGENNRVVVDGWMRPSSYPNVFALGDVALNGDEMTTVGATRQFGWLAKTLKGLSSGKPLSAMKAYTPWKTPPMLVPLGPEKGSSNLGRLIVGDFLTSVLKGKHLFVDRYKKDMGQS